MSLYMMRGISLRFCQQAFILAQRRNVLRPSSFSPVNVVPCIRRSHDGLYEMVKKRTLEARTKVNQHNNPNQTNNQAPSSSALNTASPSKLPVPPFSKGVKTAANKDPDRGGSVYNNVRVLEATGCDGKCNPSDRLRTGPAGCDSQSSGDGVGGGGGGKGSGGSSGLGADGGGGGKNTGPSGRSVDCGVPGGKSSGAGDGRSTVPTDCPGGVKSPTGPGYVAGGGGGAGSAGGRGEFGGGKGPKNEPRKSMLTKALMVLGGVAAAGGLLYWYLNSDDSEKKDNELGFDDCPPRETVPCDTNLCTVILPDYVPYLLIGGGTAAFSAFRAIKSNDPQAKVLMVTNELRKPYMRPPLSKELWYSSKSNEANPDYRFKQWTGAERSLFFEPEEFFIEPSQLLDSKNGGIAVAQGCIVKKIDPCCNKVFLSNGKEIKYEKCLIATGCSPKNLPVFQNASPGVRERVMMYRTPDDFERLKRFADQKKNIMIVGNGFIGSELACSLATYSSKCKGSKIYQVFPESGNMSRVLPEYLSKWTTRKVQDQGVCVIPNTTVRAAQRDEGSLKITLSNGTTVITDLVVVCVGCEPNTSLAYTSGLEVHPEFGGFVVNAELEARKNLFVAGDASCFYDPLLGRRRVEHHDHSVVSGRLAGENMVGIKKPYTHQSMFWSDLGPEIGYEAIGLVDSCLPTVAVFALTPKIERPTNVDNLTEERTQSEGLAVKQCSNYRVVENSGVEDPENAYGRGVIFYLKDNKVVGILLWNLFNRIGLARTIINQHKRYDDLDEVAKLFEIHS